MSRVILVVEDEPLFRELVCRALDDAGYTSVPAGTADDALKLFRLNDPDGAVIDIDLGGGPNGVVLSARLRRDVPHLPIVFLTALSDPRSVDGPAIPPDARFLRKSLVSDVREFQRVLDETLRGLPSMTRHDRHASNPLAVLSPKQMEALRFIAQGLTNEQIAEVRGTSLRAAEMLVQSTMKKLGLADDGLGNRRVKAARLLPKP